MFTKRFAIALFVIVILLAVCTACDTSTPAPSATAQPTLGATQLPIAVTSSTKVSISPADENWLIRVLNGEENDTAGQASKEVSQSNTPAAGKTFGADEDWLIRVLNGE